MSETPWPHRPPLGATLALLISLILTGLYCWITVVRLPDQQRPLLSLYCWTATWSFVPRLSRATTHRFIAPDGSTITAEPRRLYASLREHAYVGVSPLGLFRVAGWCSIGTWMVLLCCGAVWDRRYRQSARDGRLIRGPRVLTVAQYNRQTRGDGLRLDA